jgi:diphosphoinositol-polyphosphate diphosphatase
MLKDKEDAGEKICQQDMLDRLQVLMISTPKRSDLIFPKVRQQDHMAIPYTPFNQSCM